MWRIIWNVQCLVPGSLTESRRGEIIKELQEENFPKLKKELNLPVKKLMKWQAEE